MNSYEVLKAAADRIGVKALASGLRLSPALVYKWCEPPDEDVPEASGALNPLDRVKEIHRMTAHQPVIDWLCQQAGGYFVQNPETIPTPFDANLLQSTQRMVKGFSDLLNEVSAAAADDGAIALHEAERIRAEWQQLKNTAESLVAACELGVYHRTVS